MRATSLVLSAMGLVLGCHDTQRARARLEYPPYPTGYASQEGYVAQDTVGGVDYTIDEFSRPEGEVLWLGRALARDSAGQPRSVLRDTLLIPPFGVDEVLVLGQCSVGTHADVDIVALAKVEDADSFRVTVRAWRINRHTERFEAIPAASVVCSNEGYGD